MLGQLLGKIPDNEIPDKLQLTIRVGTFARVCADFALALALAIALALALTGRVGHPGGWNTPIPRRGPAIC